MKKYLLLLTLTLFSFYTYSSYWPAEVVLALEMENNLNNSGSGTYSFNNNGVIPHSNTIFLKGLFSIGLINSTGQSVYGNQAITDTVQTIQFSFNQPSGTIPDDNYFLCSTNLYIIFFGFRGALRYGDISNSYISEDISYTKDAWHTIKAEYNGTGVTVYRDKTPVVTHVVHQPTNDTFVIGSYPGGTTKAHAYFDNVLFSTANSGDGVEIPTINAPIYTPTISPTPNMTQTIVAQTATQSAMLSYTPTPKASNVPCGSPFPVVFVQNQTPVLVPTVDYEGGIIGTGGSVIEPNVILGPDGLFHMTYTSNGFYNGGFAANISMATAQYPWGPWTRVGTTPVIGSGYCGVTEPAGQSSQYKMGNEYRIYFSGLSSRHVFYATSTDGYNYTYVATPVIMSTDFNPPCVGGGGLDGMGIVYDGTNYWSLAEINSATCPGLSSYALWLCKGNANATHFDLASPTDLSDLNPFYPANHLYAGGRSTVKIGNNYHTWTHVDVPSNIYHSQSNDLYNWATDPTPVVQYSAHMFGLRNCDQAADTSIIEYAGKTYLFYDGTDNYYEEGAIGYSVYNGTLAEYDACYLAPSATATPVRKKTILH